jgi:hypothetical protein
MTLLMRVSLPSRLTPFDEEDGMRKKQWQVVGFLAALLGASTAVGQSNQGGTIADIPFPFTVANHTLPPGRYTVTPLSEKAFKIVNSQNQGAFALKNRVEGRAPKSTKMVFHRYENAYFLSEIWVAGSRTGDRVVRSRPEKELAGKRTEMEIAELQIDRVAN